MGNTEQMVSVPRELAERIKKTCMFTMLEADYDELRVALGKPAAQHQGKPVAWTYLLGGERRFFPTDPRPSHGAHANLITDAQPVYTHTDAGEVERLRYKADLYDEVWELATGLGHMNVTTAISSLRAQLAERDAALDALTEIATGYKRDLDVAHALLREALCHAQRIEPMSVSLFNRIDDSLSASAEPITQVELCSTCKGYGKYQDGDSGTDEDGRCPNIVECDCDDSERMPQYRASAPVERDERAEFMSWCASIGYTLKPSERGNGFKPGYGSELFSSWQARAALERKP